MLSIRQLVVAMALGAAAATAPAGIIEAGKNAPSGVDTQCPSAVPHKSSGLDTAPAPRFARNTHGIDRTHARCEAFAEYLSFHAEVKEQSGQSSLMPWSQLRTRGD